jgi:hypothetical protein
MAEILPDRRERGTLRARRGLVQDLRMYGGPKVVMELFGRLQALNMVDVAIVEKDLRLLAGFTLNRKEQKKGESL